MASDDDDDGATVDEAGVQTEWWGRGAKGGTGVRGGGN